MKRSFRFPFFPLAFGLAGVLAVSGCKDSGAGPGAAGGGEASAGEGGEPAAVVAPAEAVEPPRPKWTRDDAGFALHLPPDTDLYLQVRQLEVIRDLFGDFSAGEAMGRVDRDKVAEVTGEGREDIDEWAETAAAELPRVFPAVFGEEAFIAVRGLDWWLDPYAHYQQEVYPDTIAAMLTGVLSMDFGGDDPDGQQEMIVERMMDYLRKDILDRASWPASAVQMGGRVSEGRAEVVAALREWLALVPAEEPQFVTHEFERNGIRWAGFRLDWERLVKQDPANPLPEHLRDALGEDGWASLQRMAKALPLIVACAEVGDYVVLSAGLGEHAVDFAADPGGSLAAVPAFAGLGGHEEESVFGVLWTAGGVVERIHELQSWEPVWTGLAEGVAGAEHLATAPMMAQSLREIARLSGEKRTGRAHDVLGAVVVKDGLHFELRGGWQGEDLDLEAPLTLAAAVGQWENQPFLRAHWRKNAEHTAKTLRQLEEGMRLADLIKQEVSAVAERGLRELEGELDELPDPEGDGAAELERKRRLAEMMKRDFALAMENLWTGYREHFRAALGEEAALVMDLEGEAPPIIGFEEETLKRGRIPRVAYVREVRERAGLEVAWRLWRDAGVRLLGLMAEATQTPIPFPDTMSANTDGLRTHFMPMPFATDDFLPNVSVSDELFMVASSKALAARIEQSHEPSVQGRAAPSGVVAEVNMGPWWDFCEAWLDVAADRRARDAAADSGEPEEEGAGEEDILDEIEGLERLDEQPGEDPESAEPLEDWEGEAGDAGQPGEEVVVDGLSSFLEALGEASPVQLDEDTDWEPLLRGWISQARRFRGASYRKWLEDGVPRARVSFHWGTAPESAD